MALSQTVVLLGKVGHGKTSMMNKICGSNYPAAMGARSVTQHIQLGTMSGSISVIDTPGFYSSTNVAGHVAAQKFALEGLPLSGIFLVVKYARADDIAELANTVMDVIGCGDIRIAITHEDVAATQAAFDPMELRRTLSATLDIDEDKIYSFGKFTSALDVRSFIQECMHEPRTFQMSSEQQAHAASLGVCSRKLNKPISAVYAKIVAAEVACREAASHCRNYGSDFLIVTTQSATTQMVSATKRQLFEAAADYTEEQQNLMYGKAGVHLTLRLKEFTEVTNDLLSYDVADTSNPQNMYKKCNHCGAVWIKTEGCDGQTVCGSVPRADANAQRVLLESEFVQVQGGRWTLMFRQSGQAIRRTASEILALLQTSRSFQKVATNKGGGTNHQKRLDAVIESGCGASIIWSTMLPVPPDELLNMKEVEQMKEPFQEGHVRVHFEQMVQQKEKENETILSAFISRLKL